MRELDLLQHIYAGNARLPAAVVIPPGDDMGGVRLGEELLLVTVDQVADGVHFDLRQHSLQRVGRKAITRNLSDVAAMAAQPLGAVAAASLPRSLTQQDGEALCDVMRQVAEQYNCPLLGGDISLWDHPLLITVTVFAQPAGVAPVLRYGACPGDAVCVTGELGGSLEDMHGRIHHLDFEPRLAAARQLALTRRPHCLIDLSDGLAKDAGHLCRAAALGMLLDAQCLPISHAAMQRAARTGQPAWQHAVGDGEDYELCFTMPPQHVPTELAGVPVTVIGAVTAEPGLRLRLPDSSVVAIEAFGWEHR